MRLQPGRGPSFRGPGIHILWEETCSFLSGYNVAMTLPKEEVALSAWCYLALGSTPGLRILHSGGFHLHVPPRPGPTLPF